jgi:hypothetical protein
MPPFDEASGVIASRQHPGVFWAHADAARPNVLWAFLMDDGQLGTFPDGQRFRAYTVPVANVDWEDIAVDDSGHLWLADIGNNCSCRSDLVVHRLVEPDPLSSATTVSVAASYPMAWPDGNKDAESLFVLDGTAYIISKTPAPAVYALRTLHETATNTLQKVADLTTPGGGATIDRPTGADLARNRTRLAVAGSFQRVFVYTTTSPHLTGDDLVRDLVGGPPAYQQLYRPNGTAEKIEAVGFIADSLDLLLMSELRTIFHFPQWYYEGLDAPPGS